MKELLKKIKHSFSESFSLSDDREDEALIIESISKGVSFKGINVWTLIFAIIISSIGLNMNSTAVIIGAMLISPLMGPIMGVGLSIGINDFELLKKSVRNLFVAAAISIITSFLYFTITPLHEASSELLARTTPSLWDVIIAFTGGLAGIVAGTRKEKSNVIPGVAIATALMPPLCTAGYGLATGQWFYFLGALYLFFINSLFICMATFLIVKHLRFHKVQFETSEKEKKITRYMLIIAILTVLPSIYLAYRITEKSIFESNADKFVQREFQFQKTHVVTKKIISDGNQKSIQLLLVGNTISDSILNIIRKKMPDANLKNTKLIVYQGTDAIQKIDLSAIKASLLEEIYIKQYAEDTMQNSANKIDKLIPDIKQELSVLYPDLIEFSIGNSVVVNNDSNTSDTVTLFVGKFKHRLKKTDAARLNDWLKERTNCDSMVTIIK